VRPLGRALVVAVLAGALALAYLWPFRAYGLNVEDEGTLLYQVLRFARGELPYVDFATGYTPGFFALGAWLWRAAGDLVTLRVMLAVLHAATVAGLALLVARLARPSLAVVLPLLYLAFIPVYPGEFCSFNIPYPFWFTTAGWIVTAGCMLGFVRRRGRVWLVLAGVAAACTFAMKPNSGVFAIAAAAASLLLVRESGWRGGALAAALWIGLWAGVVGGVWLAFELTLRPVELVVYLLPLLGAMAALVTRSRVGRAFLVGDVAALLGTFAALSLPWMLYFLQRLGTAGFLREVLLVGSGAATLYYVPYPGFEPWALVVTALAIGFAVAGWFVAAGRVPPAPAAAVLALGRVLALAAGRGLGLMPEGPAWSIIWQLQSAAFALTLAALAAGVVWLWFRGRRPGNVAPAVVLLFALFMHLQLYPRTDFMHLLGAAPLALVFAGYLLERAFDAWERGFAARGAFGAGRLVGPVTTLLLVAGIAVAVVPGQTAIRRPDRFVLPFPEVPVGVEDTAAGEIRAVAAAVGALGAFVRRHDPSLAFPAASLTLFLSGARNPTPHDYFYPGRPDHREEAEIADRLAATPPRALVSANVSRFTFFDGAPPYFYLLRRFVRERYALVARDGRYDVLAAGGPRREPPGPAAAAPVPPVTSALAAAAAATLADDVSVAARLAAVATLADGPVAVVVPPLLAAASGPSAVLRQAALAALLDLLARDGVHGLEHHVALAELDRGQEVRLLRTVRDLRDPRAASYLFASAASADRRIVSDAVGAMFVTRVQMIARRYLWAGPEEVRAWPDRAGLLEAVRAALADPGAHARTVAFAAELARALRDAGSVPALRARWHAVLPASNALPPGSVLPPTSPASMASIGAALAELAPQGLACELLALLPGYDPEIRELVPSTFLRLAEGEEPMRSEAGACLIAALAAAGPGRAEAMWIAAALDDESLAPHVLPALSSPDPVVRRAAAWSLGEAATGDAVARALERAARADGDEIVRRLAAGALAKHAGTAPRVLGAAPAG